MKTIIKKTYLKTLGVKTKFKFEGDEFEVLRQDQFEFYCYNFTKNKSTRLPVYSLVFPIYNDHE